MCDLWKNTTDASVPFGAIPEQIEWALKKFTGIRHVKLYNSGSFFDAKAIPPEDYLSIASLLSDFITVIVESHPRLINEKCLSFRDMLKPELQVALGLETVNPEVLRRLNKQMTLDDFSNAVNFLTRSGIKTRAFILIKPPFLDEAEGIYWAERSIDFAFSCGVECCIAIPVRGGNGVMELLQQNGNFKPPSIKSLEAVMEYGIGLNKGRVFADTWDLQLFSSCDNCFEKRVNRLTDMNLKQKITGKISCPCN
jgi:radical SAM enzyme (TIGR01210 family)